MIKVVIIDDEAPAIKELKYFLSDYDIFKIVGMYTNPVEALKYIEHEPVDVVFLDIDMPYMNGIELAKNIKTLNEKIELIFVTAHQEYAINAFDVQAMDYVLKPIIQKRFNNTVERIFKICNVNYDTTNNSENIVVHCFGKFHVTNKLKEIDTIKWRTNKVKELFAYLLSRYGKSNSKQDLINILFRDFEISKALNNLYVTMFYLRKQLEELGISDQIISIEDNYRLEIKKGICDFVDFDLFTKSNIKIQNNNINEAEYLIQIYKDDFLAEEDYDWVYEIREYLQRKYEDLILKTVEYYESVGDHNKTMLHLHHLISFNSLHDEGHKKLLELYYKTNDLKMYIKQYKLYERILFEELDIKPEKKFSVLYDKIINTGI